APRHAKDIPASTWSIGGETLDRDFAVYAHYKSHLGPLGAKAIRLQAGWAKCEPTPGGAYDFRWLDAIVDDALAQGVRPWLQTSYGHPAYEGGGGHGLGGALPKEPAALAAWDKWVTALVRHYRDRVTEWEIWNEPDLDRGHNSATDYTNLFVRTATILRAEQPGAKIYALGLAGNFKFAEQFLAELKRLEKTSLMDAVTVHGYPRNPDDLGSVSNMRKMLDTYAPAAHVRQGETGAPSRNQPAFALSHIDFTETTQAKWNLRRMLAHHARGVPFNLFSIIDMHYVRDGKPTMNCKGLLASAPDQTVARVKPAYRAAQHVFTIFDADLHRAPDLTITATGADKVAATAYRRKEGTVIATWLAAAPPTDDPTPTPVTLTVTGATFTEPVLADLLTGEVHAIPRDRWSADGNTATFTAIPVYDSPILIAERAALPIGK
ncbi:MAG TPA: hypothetical protein VK986_27695, partial [Tepidisphaeraceae bacterium]|nr:hypothetical protein [Tepidisphaeraceae bacterium]